MTAHAAIAAQVVDIQNDRQHKGFIKVTLHVPAECGPQLTTAMGWPTYTTPVPVALARLNRETEVMPTETTQSQQVRRTETPPASGPDIQARARKPVDPEKRLAQRAAILCGDPVFLRYLIEDRGLDTSTMTPAEFVREFCHVPSRADIKPNTEAGLRWDLLESAFICWRDVPELADAS